MKGVAKESVAVAEFGIKRFIIKQNIVNQMYNRNTYFINRTSYGIKFLVKYS